MLQADRFGTAQLHDLQVAQHQPRARYQLLARDGHLAIRRRPLAGGGRRRGSTAFKAMLQRYADHSASAMAFVWLSTPFAGAAAAGRTACCRFSAASVTAPSSRARRSARWPASSLPERLAASAIGAMAKASSPARADPADPAVPADPAHPAPPDRLSRPVAERFAHFFEHFFEHFIDTLRAWLLTRGTWPPKSCGATGSPPFCKPSLSPGVSTRSK